MVFHYDNTIFEVQKLLDFIKRLLGQASSEKGFTLIELLVVIAILGVLLVGSIVAINPSQKINQANDANGKAAVDQVSSALQSYYTVNQTYPTETQGLDQLKTSNELRTVPTANGAALSYKATASCTGLPAAYCTDAAVYFTLKQPADAAAPIWCWQSSTGKAQTVANAAACTAP